MTTTPTVEVTSKVDFECKIVDAHDLFLFDCDGVVWRGTEAVPGAIALLKRLMAAGKKCLFVSNNATKSRSTYVAKFAGLG